MSGSTGSAKVPITCSVAFSREGTYNNQSVNMYSMQVSSSDGSAHMVSFTPTSGCSMSLGNPLDVPATGNVQLYVYVPTSQTGSVSVTASASGYENDLIPIVGGT